MDDWRIDTHHLAFGGYLAAMLIGLLAVGAWTYGALYAVLLCALLGTTYWCARAPAPRIIALNYLFFPVAMNIAFPLMRGAVPAIRATPQDALLMSLDHRLFGGSVNVWAERLVTPAVTELLSACYILFFPLLLFSLVRYFFWHKERLAQFYTGLFTIYGLGFIGYLLLPAAGPYLAYPELFDVPLQGGPITHANQALVAAGSNRVDVFPSLHSAVSAYILGFSYAHQRREFWLLLPPIVGLWMATLYLRYHYLIDVLCGLVLAGIGLLSARRHPLPIEGPVACL
jgi:hypothetical protein